MKKCKEKRCIAGGNEKKINLLKMGGDAKNIMN
jgi:hypothetical protein